jgi:hypothetical protein
MNGAHERQLCMKCWCPNLHSEDIKPSAGRRASEGECLDAISTMGKALRRQGIWLLLTTITTITRCEHSSFNIWH